MAIDRFALLAFMLAALGSSAPQTITIDEDSLPTDKIPAKIANFIAYSETACQGSPIDTEVDASLTNKPHDLDSQKGSLMATNVNRGCKLYGCYSGLSCFSPDPIVPLKNNVCTDPAEGKIFDKFIVTCT